MTTKIDVLQTNAQALDLRTLCQLAVIIPVAPGDTAWVGLLDDLRSLPLEAEILFVCPELPSGLPKQLLDRLSAGRRVNWLPTLKGRACQLNAGVRATHNPYLWFLHADSRFDAAGLAALGRSLDCQPNALHYFNLAFLADGPPLTALNALGVWVRSHLLGLPFGDQGFCLPRQLFERLHGFREDVSYGEDHLLVWQARTERIPLRCMGKTLQTSARKYQQNGWLATTLTHLILTARQAFPQGVILLRTRALGLLSHLDERRRNAMTRWQQMPRGPR